MNLPHRITLRGIQMTIRSGFGLRNILIGLLASGSLFANAALLDNGSYTTDSNTNLDWLGLTETRGLSFDEVQAQMSSGQKYEGWRFASRTDVIQFWSDAGGSGPFTGASSGESNWVGSLQSLWGKTYPFVYIVNGYTVQGTIAMTSDVSNSCHSCNLTVYLLDNIDLSDSSIGDYAEAVQLNEAYRSQGQVPIGHALVRAATPVPEPATFSMYAFGIFALASIARRSRRSTKQ